MPELNSHFSDKNFQVTPRRSTLPIIQHLVTAYKTWHEFLPHVPKDARYSLGVRIDALFAEAIESVFNATYSGGNEKLPHIKRAILKIDSIKFFLQIVWEIRALDNKKYINLSGELDNIGRMLGGWLRQVGKTNPAGGG